MQVVPFHSLRTLYENGPAILTLYEDMALVQFDVVLANKFLEVHKKSLPSSLIASMIAVLRSTQATLLRGSPTAQIERAAYTKVRLRRHEEVSLVMHVLNLNKDRRCHVSRGAPCSTWW